MSRECEGYYERGVAGGDACTYVAVSARAPILAAAFAALGRTRAMLVRQAQRAKTSHHLSVSAGARRSFSSCLVLGLPVTEW